MAPLRDLPLEEGRLGLLKWIEQAKPQGSVNNEVTVVFDGHPDHAGASAMISPGQARVQGDVRVIFSDGCSADDQIKRMVEEDKHRKNCVVVSDDKDIFLYARSLGTKVISVKDFTSAGASTGPHGRQEAAKKHISLSRQEAINKELSRLWLKEKS